MIINLRSREASLVCLAVILISSQLLAEGLSLRQAVDIATRNNPTIAASQLSAKTANISAMGAHAMANPEILIAPTVVGEAASDAAVLFSQPLEINGRRRVRGNLAEHQAAVAGFGAEAVKRDVALQVSRSYWDVALAQELVKLSEANVGYLEAIRAAVQKQYDVGVVPGSQTIKMEVESARARQDLAQVTYELSRAMSKLNVLMNRPTATDFTLSDPLFFSRQASIDSTLQAVVPNKRPEVAAAQAQLLAAREDIQSAKLLSVPDLVFQVRMESFDRNSNLGAALVFSVPILDWGSAKSEKERAKTAAQAQEKQLEATRDAVSLEVEQALQRVNTAAQIVREYQGGILEKSEQLATMARKGYEKGASSYLDVLEAQRTLRSTGAAYYTALAEHSTALAELEWASGCNIQTNNNTEAKN